MIDAKFIVNLYYPPVEELKTYINQHRDLYMPINAGSLHNSTDEWIQKNVIFETDSKDNISLLNNKINELTAIYWFWKNYEWQKHRYVGFQHYRRFFSVDELSDMYMYDAIVARPLAMTFGIKNNKTAETQQVKLNIESGYKLCHNINDFNSLSDLIPLQFKSQWDTWKLLDYLFAPCNMFLIKSEYFNQYCSELFSYMFRLLPIITINEKATDYQKRTLAFLSERITSFWFWRNRYNLKIKMVKTIFNKHWKPE